MSTILEEQGRIVQTRLEETFAAFHIVRLINELGDSSVSPDLNAKIQCRAAFWQPTLFGHQCAMFIGMDALLDRKRKDVATIYSYSEAVENLSDCAVPSDLLDGLPQIKEKYAIYRHKLFAHTDLDRPRFAKQFDVEGFSFEELSRDLDQVRLIFDSLYYLATQAQMPSAVRDPGWKSLDPKAISSLYLPHKAYVERVIADTKALLAEL